MDGAARPHCLKPEACASTTLKHCKRCCGVASIARLQADPERLRRLGEASIPRLRDPEFSVRRNALYRKNKDWRRATAAAGRAKVNEINCDPELSRRRREAMMASVPRRVRENAKRLAAKAEIPVELVEEYRHLRGQKHHDIAQAVTVLRASYPGVFIAFDTKRAVERNIGPQPAIGTAERAAWLRRKHGEARP